ncbi:MAG: hypothetical protein LM582_01750 [Desulfurococcaceae archaeon]|jgi:hypothetical protein|nr:hypothetical protein [Desulfurococcaceae archaeon]
MKLYLDEFEHYNNIKRLASIISKPCIWSIISILNESTDKTLNITALTSKLNSNYRAVSRCIEYMKKLNIVEEIVIGRLRLIKLLDTRLAQAMDKVLNELKYNSDLFFNK